MVGIVFDHRNTTHAGLYVRVTVEYLTRDITCSKRQGPGLGFNGRNSGSVFPLQISAVTTAGGPKQHHLRLESELTNALTNRGSLASDKKRQLPDERYAGQEVAYCRGVYI